LVSDSCRKSCKVGDLDGACTIRLSGKAVLR
jgi:hypothetical protein